MNSPPSDETSDNGDLDVADKKSSDVIDDCCSASPLLKTESNEVSDKVDSDESPESDENGSPKD